jgi:molecular chaperone IbpA
MEDVVMRTSFDFAPLYRSSVGFDRIFGLLENATRGQMPDNWPPYDIAKISENAYRISMAVAGFSQDELDVSTQPNLLVVAGQKNGEPTGEYLHRGIANRSFTRRFELADHVKVTGANFVNGLLTIDLQREIPDEMKPRRIEIKAATLQAQAGPLQVGEHVQAA